MRSFRGLLYQGQGVLYKDDFSERELDPPALDSYSPTPTMIPAAFPQNNFRRPAWLCLRILNLSIEADARTPRHCSDSINGVRERHDTISIILCKRYTVDLSNLNRLKNGSTVSHQPETGKARIQTLAYKESTTFPTCSSVSIAAP